MFLTVGKLYILETKRRRIETVSSTSTQDASSIQRQNNSRGLLTSSINLESFNITHDFRSVPPHRSYAEVIIF